MSLYCRLRPVRILAVAPANARTVDPVQTLNDGKSTSMHPHTRSDEHDDDYEDGNVPPVAFIELPPLCDEAALQFSELLKDFLEQFDDYYRREIRRAIRVRRKKEKRRIRKLEARAAKKDLPGFDFSDAPPF